MLEKKKKYTVLALLVLALLVVRLSILVFSPYPILNDIEDIYRAHAAQALLKGGYPFRLFDYQYVGHLGGHLPVILMTAASFLLCGVNHLSLRLPSFIVGSGEIVLLYLFLHRYFNRRVALISSLLFIFSPLPFFFRGLRCFGDHRESVIFTLAAVFVFYRILFDGEDRKSNFILLGIISGFATYCCYIYLVTLAWIILLWFIFDKEFFLKKGFLLFAISFLVGFSPGIYSEITYDFRGFSWLGRFLRTGGLNIGSRSANPSFSIFSKIKTFLGPYLIFAMGFRDTPSLNGWNLGVIYYAIFVVSTLFIIWSNRKSLGKLLLGLFPIIKSEISPKDISRESPLLVYMGIFSLVFVGSIGTNYMSDLKPWRDLLVTLGHSEDYYNYLMPLYIFIFIAISIFLDRLWAKRNRFLKLSSFSLLTVLISIGLVGNIDSFEMVPLKPINKVIPFQEDKSMFYSSVLGTMLFRLSLRETARMVDKIRPEEKDDFYLSLGILLGPRFWEDADTCIQMIDEIEPIYRKYFCQGMSRTLFFPRHLHKTDMLRVFDRIDPEYRKYLYQGIGFALGYGVDPKSSYSIQGDSIAAEYRDYFYQGLGYSLEWRFGDDINTYIQMIDKIPPEYRSYFYQGLGFHLDWRFGRDIPSYIEMANRINPEYRRYFYQGLGLSLEWRFGDDINTYIQMLDEIPTEYRGYFYQGLGRNTYWRLGGDISAYIRMADRIEPTYRGYFYRGWVSRDLCLIFGDSPEEYMKLIKRIDRRYRHFIYQGIKWGLNYQSIKQREGHFDTTDAGKPILYDLLKDIEKARLVNPRQGAKAADITRAIIRIGEDKRLAIFAPCNSEIDYSLSLDEKALLSFGIGVPEEFWKEGKGFLAQVFIRSDGNKQKLFSKYLNPSKNPHHRSWFDYEIDLSGYAAKKVTLSLETYTDSRSSSEDGYALGGLCWAYPQIK